MSKSITPYRSNDMVVEEKPKPVFGFLHTPKSKPIHQCKKPGFWKRWWNKVWWYSLWRCNECGQVYDWFNNGYGGCWRARAIDEWKNMGGQE